MSSELNESELGTQEYWDNRYKTEINNFNNHGDIGEIWFGEESTQRICRWILRQDSIKKSSKIIDLGCGNGQFLLELAEEDFEHLTGVDYSEDGIRLAKEIARKEQVNIEYNVMNILTDKPTDKYDIVHDKGTYDAISLSSNAKNNREIYIDTVYEMLDTNSLFIITSCNWTKEELEEHFSEKFHFLHQIPTPKFQFGGKTGNTVTTLVFQK